MANVYAFESSLVMMIAATFVLAGMVKGVTGMGLPTVAMGILGSLISPVAAAAMLLLPSLISNLFQFGSGGNTRQLLKRLWPMLLTVVVATLLAQRLDYRGRHHPNSVCTRRGAGGLRYLDAGRKENCGGPAA